ncbi:hypothetical protein RZS08_01215, partial [Arthrospira platensis SPKY1]|nr:hypothetical protein [Arthrospira platensis SPKY1]
LELRDAQNIFVAAITDADGVWPGGANTTTNTRRSVSSIGTGDAILAPDADGDNIADCDDNCPNLAGVQGDACDDGDPLTVNDTINASCVCVGQAEDCEGTP